MSGSYNRLLLSCDCDENYHKPHSGFMVGIAQVLPTDGVDLDITPAAGMSTLAWLTVVHTLSI